MRGFYVYIDRELRRVRRTGYKYGDEMSRGAGGFPKTNSDSSYPKRRAPRGVGELGKLGNSGNSGTRATRTTRTTRETRETRETLETRETRGAREIRTTRTTRETRKIRTTRTTRDTRGTRETRETRETRGATFSFDVVKLGLRAFRSEEVAPYLIVDSRYVLVSEFPTSRRLRLIISSV